MLEVDAFLGPYGGMLAVAFAMGCVAGWGFAQKTTLKITNEARAADAERHKKERAEDKERIAALEKRVQELEDQRFNIAREK